MHPNRPLLLRALLMALLALTVTACDSGGPDETEEPPPLVPNQEGFFVFGTNTIAADALDPDARMARAVLDPGQGAQVENLEGVYGKFMYVGAGGTIEFLDSDGETATSYGVDGSRMSGEEIANVPLTSQVFYGTLQADGPAVTVPEAGLYYTFVNTNDQSVVVMKVEANIIGDATEGQWTTSTPLPMVSASEEGAVFEATDVPLTGASGYRYRFSQGFHAYASPDVVTLSSLGVEDYATAWDTRAWDVGFFLDNIPNHDDGLFTLRLEFDAATGEWTETKTRTGDRPVDFSAIQMALIGSAFEGGSFNGDGTGGLNIHSPALSGDVYTWTWAGVELIQDGEFIFLEGATWGGLQIDYTGATVEGPAVDDGQIVDATSVGGEFHNFFVAEAGTYDLTLEIDGATGARVITIAPVD